MKRHGPIWVRYVRSQMIGSLLFTLKIRKNGTLKSGKPSQMLRFPFGIDLGVFMTKASFHWVGRDGHQPLRIEAKHATRHEARSTLQVIRSIF